MTQAGSQTEAFSETRADRIPRAAGTRWWSMRMPCWMRACASNLSGALAVGCPTSRCRPECRPD